MVGYIKKNRINNMYKIFIISVIVIIPILVILSSIVLFHNPENQTDIVVEKTIVKRGTIPITINEVGVLAVIKEWRVTPKRHGKIVELIPEESIVKKDDVLMQLETYDLEKSRTDLESSLKSAKAFCAKRLETLQMSLQLDELTLRRSEAEYEFANVKVANASLELDTISRLYGKDIVSKNALDIAQRNLRDRKYDLQKSELLLIRQKNVKESNIKTNNTLIMQAEYELNNVQRRLDDINTQIEDSILRAPVGGIVLYGTHWSWEDQKFMKYKNGDNVSPRRHVLSIPELTGFKVLSQIDETLVSQIKINQDVIVKIDALPNLPFNAKVSMIGQIAIKRSESEGAGGSVNKDYINKVVIVEISTDFKDSRLRPGMTVSVHYQVETLDNVKYVDKNAVFLEGNKHILFLIINNKIKQIPIKVTHNTDKWCVFEGKVKNGDIVLLERPIDRLEKR